MFKSSVLSLPIDDTEGLAEAGIGPQLGSHYGHGDKALTEAWANYWVQIA